jgi:hypothetical protein
MTRVVQGMSRIVGAELGRAFVDSKEHLKLKVVRGHLPIQIIGLASDRRRNRPHLLR